MYSFVFSFFLVHSTIFSNNTLCFPLPLIKCPEYFNFLSFTVSNSFGFSCIISSTIWPALSEFFSSDVGCVEQDRCYQTFDDHSRIERKCSHTAESCKHIIDLYSFQQFPARAGQLLAAGSLLVSCLLVSTLTWQETSARNEQVAWSAVCAVFFLFSIYRTSEQQTCKWMKW